MIFGLRGPHRCFGTVEIHCEPSVAASIEALDADEILSRWAEKTHSTNGSARCSTSRFEIYRDLIVFDRVIVYETV